MTPIIISHRTQQQQQQSQQQSVDVECRGESNAIFLRPVSNRLRSQNRRPEILATPAIVKRMPVAAALRQEPPSPLTAASSRPSLQCRSESKTLDLRPRPSNKRKYARHLRNGASVDANETPVVPFLKYHDDGRGDDDSHAIRDFRERVMQYYLQLQGKSLAPYNIYNPYDPYNAYPPTLSQGQNYYPAAGSVARPPYHGGYPSPPTTTTAVTTTTDSNLIFELGESNVSKRPTKAPSKPSHGQPVTTRIVLRPSALAKAGENGVAISSPLSTAYVKRGDYVKIEYLPEANADVGKGGVAIARPELIIHFIDRKK